MEVYNENEEIIYLVYFDANNLNGWAMAQWLPHGDFVWVPNVDINYNSVIFNLAWDLLSY